MDSQNDKADLQLATGPPRSLIPVCLLTS